MSAPAGLGAAPEAVPVATLLVSSCSGISDPGQAHGLVAVAAIVSFATAFGVGANDVANAFATSVGSGAISLRTACYIAAVAEFSGATLMGSAVTKTLKGKIVDAEPYDGEPERYMLGMIAVMFATFLWLLLATWFKLPVSTTHTVIGGLVGYAFCTHAGAIQWGAIAKVVISWITAPGLAGPVAALLFYVVLRWVLRHEDPFRRARHALPVAVYFVFAVGVSFLVLSKGVPAMKELVKIMHPALVLLMALGIALLITVPITVFFIPRLAGGVMAADPKTFPWAKAGEDKEKKGPHHGKGHTAPDIGEPTLEVVVGAGQSAGCRWAPAGWSPRVGVHRATAHLADGDQVGCFCFCRCRSASPADPPPAAKEVHPPRHDGSPSPPVGTISPPPGAVSAPAGATPPPPSSPPPAVSPAQLLTGGGDAAERARAAASFVRELEADITAGSAEAQGAVTAALVIAAATVISACDHSEESGLSSSLKEESSADPEKHADPQAGSSSDPEHSGHDSGNHHPDDHHDDHEVVPLSALQPARRGGTPRQLSPREAAAKKKGKQFRTPKSPRSQAAADAHELGVARAEGMFRYLQVVSGAFASFAHGANDTANAIGPFAAVWGVYTAASPGEGTMAGLDGATPIWVLGAGGVGIVLGLSIWGWRIIDAMGRKLVVMTPTRGFTIQTGSALVVMLATFIGVPVSSTHCQIGATVGVGLTEGKKSAVNWPMLIKVVAGWVVTLIIAAGTSAMMYGILEAALC